MGMGNGAAGTAAAGTSGGGTPSSGQPTNDGQQQQGQQQPPTGGKPGSSGTGQQGQAQQGQQADDGAELREALRKEREERKKAEKERDALLPTAERDARELQELRNQQAGWQQERARLLLESQTVSTATRLGFADPGDAVALLERSGLLKRSDDGTPTNVEEALTKLLEQKPYLRASAVARPPGSAEGGTRGAAAQPGSGFDMNQWIRSQKGGRTGG